MYNNDEQSIIHIFWCLLFKITIRLITVTLSRLRNLQKLLIRISINKQTIIIYADRENIYIDMYVYVFI